MKGLQWRVGCGRSVGIYNSNWLPCPITFGLISQPILPNDFVVADLILDGNCWNIPMLRQHFLDVNVQQIMKIKLPYQSSEDTILWHYDREGEYSMKSGYNLAVQIRDSKFAVSSRDDSYRLVAVWKLHVPLKESCTRFKM